MSHIYIDFLKVTPVLLLQYWSALYQKSIIQLYYIIRLFSLLFSRLTSVNISLQ